MKHIVVTTDFSKESEKAFPLAVELYRAFPGSRLTLLTILEDLIPVSVQFEFGLTFIDYKGLQSEISKQAEEKCQSFKKQYFAGLPVEVHLVRATRPVAAEITDFAAQKQADIVIIATHGRTGIGHFLMGSVAERVVRESSVPVIVVPVKKA